MIAIGSDHAGYSLKYIIAEYFKSNEIEYIDFGPSSEDSVDFPDFAEKVVRSIQRGESDKGILICGTGIGMSIAANKFRNINAALCTTEFHARLSRQHNNSNILVMGSRVTGKDLAISILEEWLKTEYLGGRYEKRNIKIRQLEDKAGRED